MSRSVKILWILRVIHLRSSHWKIVHEMVVRSLSIQMWPISMRRSSRRKRSSRTRHLQNNSILMVLSIHSIPRVGLLWTLLSVHISSQNEIALSLPRSNMTSWSSVNSSLFLRVPIFRRPRHSQTQCTLDQHLWYSMTSASFRIHHLDSRVREYEKCTSTRECSHSLLCHPVGIPFKLIVWIWWFPPHNYKKKWFLTMFGTTQWSNMLTVPSPVL